MATEKIISQGKFYTKTVSGVTWTVNEQSDGLVIMWANLTSMSFACTNSGNGVYYSDSVNLDLPVTISNGVVIGNGNQISTVINTGAASTIVSLRVMTAVSRAVQGPNICVIAHK